MLDYLHRRTHAMFCSVCGSLLMDNAKFCIACGAAVSSQSSSSDSHEAGSQAHSQGYESSNSNGQSTAEQGTFNRFGEIKSNVQKVLDTVTGDSGEPTITFRQLFAEMFQKHQKEDLDDLLISGTYVTEQNKREWKKPWLFFRVFAVLGIAFLILYLCYEFYAESASRMVPGMVFMGALAVPASLMIFFWETNEPKNISLFDVIRIFFVGGSLSLLLTFIIQSVFTALALEGSNIGGNLIMAIIVGISEETAKLIVIYFFSRKLKNSWILNGLLIGAIVGTGFAVFETAGYAMTMASDLETLRTIIFQRGILSVGGHVIWSAIAGAALMLVQNGGDMKRENIFTAPFFRLFAFPVGLHFLWDFVAFNLTKESQQTLLWIFLIFLSIVGWVIIVKLINRGLKDFAQRKEIKIEA